MTNILFLSSAAAAPGVYYAYQNSDSVGKTIVLILIFGSILTWSVMVSKAVELYKARKSAYRFAAAFRANTKNIAAPALRRQAEKDIGPTAAIYDSGVTKLINFYEEHSSNSDFAIQNDVITPCRLSEAQYNAIEAVLEREVSIQLQGLETKIGLLATLVSLSPFCGLFGTVWGVMMAFCGIAAAGKSDFTALAPGVAGALLTTVAGLIVAIPSLVGYNMLTGMIKQITVAMDNFTEEFIAKIKLEQLKFDSSNRE